jgi:hypothetical protein
MDGMLSAFGCSKPLLKLLQFKACTLVSSIFEWGSGLDQLYIYSGETH